MGMLESIIHHQAGQRQGVGGRCAARREPQGPRAVAGYTFVSNKANLWLFWADNEGWAEKQSQSKPIPRWGGLGRVRAVSSGPLGIGVHGTPHRFASNKANLCLFWADNEGWAEKQSQFPGRQRTEGGRQSTENRGRGTLHETRAPGHGRRIMSNKANVPRFGPENAVVRKSKANQSQFAGMWWVGCRAPGEGGGQACFGAPVLVDSAGTKTNL